MEALSTKLNSFLATFLIAKSYIAENVAFDNGIHRLRTAGVEEEMALKISSLVRAFSYNNPHEVIKAIAQLAAKGAANYDEMTAIIESCPRLFRNPAGAQRRCFGSMSWAEFLNEVALS